MYALPEEYLKEKAAVQNDTCLILAVLQF